MLSFEILQAQEGDCFVMRWKEGAATRIGVIDGGPRAADGHRHSYLNLVHRLDALKTGSGPLTLDWVMVSHIDDDHINGLLKMMTKLRDARESGDEPPYEIRRFWFNAFEDVADATPAKVASIAGTVASAGGYPDVKLGHRAAAVLASVGQGRTLRDALDTLRLAGNAPVGGFVKSGSPVVDIDGLKVTVVGPLEAQLEALRKDWKKTKPRSAKEAAYADESVANLSSIVCHVAYKAKSGATRTLLLTGDARGDYMLKGLKEAGLLKDGKLKVDLLKVQHHGSDRNVEEGFFEQVPADHYVISANGKHGNPDVPTLKWLIAARDKDRYTLHISNKLPWMEAFFTEQRKGGRQFEVIYRGEPDDDTSIDIIDLD
jgi:hypothetical protein